MSTITKSAFQKAFVAGPVRPTAHGLPGRWHRAHFMSRAKTDSSSDNQEPPTDTGKDRGMAEQDPVKKAVQAMRKDGVDEKVARKVRMHLFTEYQCALHVLRRSGLHGGCPRISRWAMHLQWKAPVVHVHRKLAVCWL
jgi:hypothetical protein